MISRFSPIRHSFARQLCRRFPVSLASDERGSTAAFVAIGMLMMLGMVALAVDVGMLVGARTDSQRTADAAALAGAASFITSPNDADRPRQWAIDYAAKNTVHGTAADVRAEDVDVLMAEKNVRVRVRNITARSNAIRTIFGRVLGWDEVNVGTAAAAEATAAGYGNCMLPLALPDRWTETDGDDIYIGLPDDHYVPYYQAPGVTGSSQCSPGVEMGVAGCDFTGYYPGDINDPTEPVIEIKVQSGPADPEDPDYVASPCVDAASWRCWFQPESVNSGPVGGGANNLRPWIQTCVDTSITIGIGDTIYAGSASGNMQSLVLQDFRDLIDYNPGVWNPTHPTHPYGGCVTVDGGDGDCLGSNNTMRIRFMPVVKTDEITGTGGGVQGIVIGLACVFVDKVSSEMSMPHGMMPPPGQWNVYVRLTDTCVGVSGGDGPILAAIRLVE